MATAGTLEMQEGRWWFDWEKGVHIQRPAKALDGTTRNRMRAAAPVHILKSISKFEKYEDDGIIIHGSHPMNGEDHAVLVGSGKLEKNKMLKDTLDDIIEHGGLVKVGKKFPNLAGHFLCTYETHIFVSSF